jgi:hypothetical protein
MITIFFPINFNLIINDIIFEFKLITIIVIKFHIIFHLIIIKIFIINGDNPYFFHLLDFLGSKIILFLASQFTLKDLSFNIIIIQFIYLSLVIFSIIFLIFMQFIIITLVSNYFILLYIINIKEFNFFLKVLNLNFKDPIAFKLIFPVIYYHFHDFIIN